MENIKNELINLIDKDKIADFFVKVDELAKEGKVGIENLHSLELLRKEFIFGNIGADYFSRLKVWISISIVIVVNPLPPVGGNSQTKSTNFCQEIKELIRKGKLDKAIDKLLEVLQDKDEENDILLLSSRYHTTKSNLDKGIITDTQANQTFTTITEAILKLLKELC